MWCAERYALQRRTAPLTSLNHIPAVRWQRLFGVSDEPGIHEALTSPDADDADRVIVAAVHDAKRRMLELTEPRRLELRNDSAAVRKPTQLTDTVPDLGHCPHADVRHALMVRPHSQYRCLS